MTEPAVPPRDPAAIRPDPSDPPDEPRAAARRTGSAAAPAPRPEDDRQTARQYRTGTDHTMPMPFRTVPPPDVVGTSTNSHPTAGGGGTPTADPATADPTTADPTAADPTATADLATADPTTADPTAADPTATADLATVGPAPSTDASGVPRPRHAGSTITHRAGGAGYRQAGGLLAHLADRAGDAGGTPSRTGTPLTHIERLPARTAVTAEWPPWTPDALRAALGRQGIGAPWAHQATAATLAYEGRHVVIATGTGSGKSLAYQLPVLAALLTDQRATAMYLAPTKALAADQARATDRLGLPGIRSAGYDGDTPTEERDWVRRYGRLVLTNPDMLHRGILPRHQAWATFLRRLRYVVVDECHSYRGVFGSHVAQVLRRLRRVAARYGSDPVFILASATTAEPAASATALTGLPVREVAEDRSPRGGVTFALWQPPVLPEAAGAGDAAPVRASALRETANLLAGSVATGTRTLAFVRSRRGAEAVAAMARRTLAETAPALAERVAAYRAGYLREERRALERGLLDGSLLGIASTNALELGVDLVGLDAVLLAGYPGTLASMWQQAGRAGRAGRDALCVLVARDDPLDTYLVHHPEALFGRPVERTMLDPANPYVLAPHLCAAAAELPLTEADLDLFGGEVARATVARLVADRLLRRRPTGWYWTSRHRPDVDLRGTGGDPVAVVEESTGRLLGTVDAGSAHFMVHPGAVYVHQGASYVVDNLDLDDGSALVHPEEPDWTTHARDVTSLSVVDVTSYVDAGGVGLFLGTVDVSSQVVSYQRRRIATGEILDTRPLDLPVRQLRTTAVWWTISPAALTGAGVAAPDVPGALHAAEHASIGLLPLVATCDRWDIGGLSTAAHPDTGAPTVFVYDGHPGGAGFAERAYHTARQWLRATRDTIDGCTCEAGCPSCVQSPKCGNGNDPLGKDDAVRVLDAVLHALARTEAHPGPAH